MTVHRVVLAEAERLPFADGEADAVVTDPPGALGIGGAAWDSAAGGRDAWIRKHVPAFAEVRRCTRRGGLALFWSHPRTSHWTATALEDAGWVKEDEIVTLHGNGMPKGQRALRPAHEDWVLCRAPGGAPRVPATLTKHGRPPNVALLHDRECAGEAHAASCAVAELVRRAGVRRSGKRRSGVRKGIGYRGRSSGDGGPATLGSVGTADRFFPTFRYEPKARGRQRDVFLPEGVENENPAAKSLALCAWLVSLVSDPGELVLDPFCGWGSVLCAALLLGRQVLGSDRDPLAVEMTIARLANAARAMADCFG